MIYTQPFTPYITIFSVSGTPRIPQNPVESSRLLLVQGLFLPIGIEALLRGHRGRRHGRRVDGVDDVTVVGAFGAVQLQVALPQTRRREGLEFWRSQKSRQRHVAKTRLARLVC